MTAAAIAMALLVQTAGESMAAPVALVRPPNPLPLDRAKVVSDARFRPLSVQMKQTVRVTITNNVTQKPLTLDLGVGDTYHVSQYRLSGITLMVGLQHATVPWESTDAMERALTMARKAVDPDTEILLVPPPPPTALEALNYQDHEGASDPSYKKERKDYLRSRDKQDYLSSDRWTRNQAIPKLNDPTLVKPTQEPRP